MAHVGGRRTIGERTSSRKPVVTEIVPSSAWTEENDSYYLLVDLPDFKTNEVKLEVDSSDNSITVSGERLLSDKTKIIRFEQRFDLPSNSDIDAITGKYEGEILYVTVPKKAVEEQENNISGNSTRDHTVEGTTQSLDNNINKDENAIVDDQDHIKDGNAKVDDEDHEKDENAKVDDEVHHGQVQQGCEFGGDKKDKNSKVDSFSRELVEKWGREPSQMDWAIKILKRNKGIVFTAIVAFSFGVMISRKFGYSTRPEQCPI